MINYRLKINFQDTKILTSDMCFVSGDVNANKLIFEFYDNGERVDISGYTLSVKSKRSDGVVLASAGKIEKNTGVFVPENSVYAVPGELYMEIALSDASGKYITTKIITAEVIKGLDNEPIEATDNISVYVTLLNDIQHKIEMTNVALEETREIVKNPAFIGENNNWYVYDEESGTYVDSGVCATAPEADKAYNPESENAQSGKAVAEAVQEVKTALDEKANVSDIYYRGTIDAMVGAKADKNAVLHIDTFNAAIATKADINNVYYRGTIDEKLRDKVDKVEGKGLSSNDFTDADKEKIDALQNQIGDKADKSEVENLITLDHLNSRIMPLQDFLSYYISESDGMDLYTLHKADINALIADIGHMYNELGGRIGENNLDIEALQEQIGNLSVGGGGTWELAASYTHEGNRVIQPTALDKTTGYFTCENHGLVEGQPLMVLEKTSFYNQLISYIPYELYQKANYNDARLFIRLKHVTIIDENTFALTKYDGSIYTYTDTRNSNVDATKFYFETINSGRFAGFNNLNIDMREYDIKIVARNPHMRINLKINDVDSNNYYTYTNPHGHDGGLGSGVSITPVYGVYSNGEALWTYEDNTLFNNSKSVTRWGRALTPISTVYVAENYMNDIFVYNSTKEAFAKNPIINKLTFNLYYSDEYFRNGGSIKIWKRKK